MVAQNAFGLDRYLTWVNSESKLRSRINLDSYELFSEQIGSSWKNQGKINVDPAILSRLPREVNNKTFSFDNDRRLQFTITGTGQVYEYDTEERRLTRLDETFHSGYNFTSTQFLRKNVIYSIGGEGFWNYNNSITYFDEKLKEWEITRTKNKGPKAITTGYQGYSASSDVFYSGGASTKEFLEIEATSYLNDLFLFDFKKNSWKLLGKINPELPYDRSMEIIWTGDVFLHFANGRLFIINPQKNEVYLYEDNEKNLNMGQNAYVLQDSLITFNSTKVRHVVKLSISEIQQKAKYFGKFYSAGISWYWYSLGLFLILIIMTILKWKRKENTNSANLIFTAIEKRFLNKLLDLKPNEYLNTFEINDILETNDKTQENQRKIRFNVIGQLNKKLKSKYNWDNAIERKPLPEDKRLTVYMLDPLVAAELKRLIR